MKDLLYCLLAWSLLIGIVISVSYILSPPGYEPATVIYQSRSNNSIGVQYKDGKTDRITVGPHFKATQGYEGNKIFVESDRVKKLHCNRSGAIIIILIIAFVVLCANTFIYLDDCDVIFLLGYLNYFKVLKQFV